MAAINCTALLFAYNWTVHKRFGISYGKVPIDPIVDKFKIDTGCAGVESCDSSEPCVDEDFIICNLVIPEIEILERKLDGTIILRITPENGEEPYMVTWVVDTNNFNIISGQGTTTLTIKAIDAQDSTDISVTALDGIKCVAKLTDTVLVPYAVVDCDSIEFTPGSAFEGIGYSGMLFIDYVVGNGVVFSGMSIPSQGVLGLTATIISQNLENGPGLLTFNISGTPTSQGNAVFPLEIFGVTCSATLPVSTAACVEPFVTVHIDDYDPDNNNYPVTLNWDDLGNAESYMVNLEINGIPEAPATIIPPLHSYSFVVPINSDFSGAVVTTCTSELESTPGEFSGSTPGAAECTAVDADDVFIGSMIWNTTESKWYVQIQWPDIPNAVGYVAIDLATSITYTTTVSEIVIPLPPGEPNNIIIIKTGCGATESSGTFKVIATPDAPFPPAPELPEILTLTNVGTPNHLELWFRIDSTYITAQIKQGDLFGSYVSDSGLMTKGVSNGFTPLPGGFTADDIFFNASTGPKGYPIIGNDITKLKVTLNSGSFSYNFDFIMNVPQAYTVRQDTLDYIPLYDAVIRPIVSVASSAAGTITMEFDPNTLNYDSCSSYNFFMVSPSGGIVTGSGNAVSNPLNQHTFTLPSGQYYAFFEMGISSCTFPSYRTAVPILVTVP